MQMGKKGPRWAQKHQTPANFDKTLPPVTEESGSESSFVNSVHARAKKSIAYGRKV